MPESTPPRPPHPHRRWLRLLGFFLPLLLALIVFVRLRQTSRELPQIEQAQALPVQQVEKIQPTLFVPRVRGTGTLVPDKIWQAIAQVEGRLVYTHPYLRSGQTVSAGTLLLRIDPKSYQLSVRQSRAELARIDAELAQLRSREGNDRSLLKLEQQSLVLAQKALKRAEQLAAEQAVPQTQVDLETRNLLKQEYLVQQLNNSLSLNPVSKQTLLASREAALANLEKARLNLSDTEIRAPFSGQLAQVQLEQGQYVTARQKLLEIYGRQSMKVDAHLPLFKLRQLLSPAQFQQISTELNRTGSVSSLAKYLKIQVSFPGESADTRWPARLVALRENTQESTRTLILSVLLDKTQVVNASIPLLKGLFAEIEFEGPPQPQQILIPQRALHQGKVYLADAQNKLQIRSVQTGLEQGDLVAVMSGLKQGDRILLTVPEPFLPGMALRVQENRPKP